MGLLSKANRDLSTTRSFEIPYLGGLLCAQRTAEHTSLFSEDQEAIFWSDPDECAFKCMDLLEDETRRRRIAIAGRARTLQNGMANERVLAQILCTLVHVTRMSPRHVA